MDPQNDKREIEALVKNLIHEILRDELKNGWTEWSKSVLQNLDELNAKCGLIDEKQQQIRTTLEVLKSEVKIKSGIWGLVGGALPIVLALAVWFLKGFLIK